MPNGKGGRRAAIQTAQGFTYNFFTTVIFLFTMARDYYDTLEVPENANDAWIQRSYRALKLRLEVDTGLTEKQKRAGLAEVETAFRTLTSVAAREKYDQKLRSSRGESFSNNALSSVVRSPTFWFCAFIVLAIGGALAWQNQMERERAQLEKVQMADRQDEERRKIDVNAKREREKLRLKEEIKAQREAEDTLSRIANEARQVEMKGKQFVADERYQPPYQVQVNAMNEWADAYRRYSKQQRQPYEDAANLRRAQADVDRQRRYLEQREREEQYARMERDFKTRYAR